MQFTLTRQRHLSLINFRGGIMAGLSITLLGPFQVAHDGRPLIGFESNKVRALLAYLATEQQRPHARETLAGLLWPDYPQRSALNNLRSALANLRQTIGDRDAQPPYLLISRETLQFNQASNHTLDIAHFAELPRQSPQQFPEQLEQAVAAYSGRFLDGFSLADSAPLRNGSSINGSSMIAVFWKRCSGWALIMKLAVITAGPLPAHDAPWRSNHGGKKRTAA